MKYLKTLLFEMILYISLTLIATILYYFNITSDKLNSIIKIVIFVIVFILSGINISKRSNKKYYLEGLKISGINILLFTIISIIFKSGFNLKQIIYYLLIILITTFGSIIGGLKRKK